MIYIGIDPGLDGAIAVYNPDAGHVLKRLVFHDMPTLAIKRGKTKKREVDAHAFRQILLYAGRLNDPMRVIIEQSGPHERDGSMQAWKTGSGWGIVYGVVVGYGLPIQIVTVQRWKKAMGATADKDLSRKLAMSAFPEQADHLTRKKDNGRAEAALIAAYAYALDRGTIAPALE